LHSSGHRAGNFFGDLPPINRHGGSRRSVRGIDDRFEIKRQRVVQRGIELVDHLAHRMRALALILRQHARNEPGEQRWNLPCWYEFRNRLLLRSSNVEVRVVGRIAREKLVGERAKPVNVIGLRRRFSAELLRTRRERRQALLARGLRRRPFRTRGSEVRELHSTARIKQYVTRLQVTVNNAALVGVLERLRDVEKHRNDVEISAASKAAKITAVRELHGQNHYFPRAMRWKYLQHRRVIQAARNRVLALKYG